MTTGFSTVVAVRDPVIDAQPGHAEAAQARLEELLTREARRAGGWMLGSEAGQAICVLADPKAALRLAATLHAAAPGAGLGVGIHGGPVSRDRSGAGHRLAPLAGQLASAAGQGGTLISQAVRDTLGDAFGEAIVAHGPIDGTEPPLEAFRVTPDMRHSPRAILAFGPFELDTERFELRREGKPVTLEPRTFDLLALLARNMGRTVTKDEIFATVWKGRAVSDAALSSQVKAARQALGDSGARQAVIATVHGRGFRLRRLAPASADWAEPADAQRPDVPRLMTVRPAIVVLPFANLDHDGGGAVLADGVTEDIVTALSRNRWLNVIARNPAFAFRGADSNIVDLVRKLGADYVVSGTLQRAGNRVRVNAQLSDALDQRSIWSERFDRELVDVFDLQEEISRLVAARVANELGINEQRKAAARPRRNRGAWELYQLGSAEFYRFNPASNLRAQLLFRQAIRVDPEFSEPYSRLAYAMVLNMVYFEGAVEGGTLDAALDYAMRGVACDEEDANAYFALGRVRLARREYQMAIDALEQSLDLNPCLALAHCGLGDSLAYEGRLDESIRHFETAIALSPYDPFRWAFMSYRALAHLFGEEYEAAAQWSRKAAQVPNAHYSALVNRLAALGHIGARDQIDSARHDLERLKPGFSRKQAEQRLFFVKQQEHLAAILEGLRKAGVN